MKHRKIFTFVTILFSFFLLMAGLAGNSGCGGDSDGEIAETPVPPSFGTAPDQDFDGDGIINQDDPDADADGSEKTADCNDLNADIYPGAVDLPDADAVDSNCDNIDGDLSKSVWVSANEGADANAGSITEPVKTIGKGLALAKADPAKPAVYVVEGDYAEDVNVTDNISLYGGFSALNADNLREHDIDVNVANITGDASGAYTFKLDGKPPMTMNYVLLLDASDSAVDGFSLACGTDGIAAVLSDSSANFENNSISCPTPAASRNITIGVAAFITDLAAKNLEVNVRKNSISLNGTEDEAHGRDFAIMAFPTENADRELLLTAEENVISLKGKSNVMAGIFAVDNDDDPTDDASGDGKASISLVARKNNIFAAGTGEAKVGVFAGGISGFALLDIPTLRFIEEFEASHNIIRFEPDPSGSSMTIGVFVSLARKPALVANNLMSAQSTGLFGFNGIMSAVSSTDILNNSYHISGGQFEAIGIYSVVRADAEATKYTDSQMGVVANNIFSFSTATASPCAIIGFHEIILDSNPALIGRVSPTELKNNDIFFDTTCATEAYYADDQAGTHVLVTDLATLHNKTGFDVTDPTVMADNISENPLFTDSSAKDFSLQSGSPCIDAGIELSDVTEDIVGTLRPQGASADMGAYEFLE